MLWQRPVTTEDGYVGAAVEISSKFQHHPFCKAYVRSSPKLGFLYFPISLFSAPAMSIQGTIHHAVMCSAGGPSRAASEEEYFRRRRMVRQISGWRRAGAKSVLKTCDGDVMSYTNLSVHFSIMITLVLTQFRTRCAQASLTS
eukprot:3214136-Rhodomonas_salina.3